MYPGVSMLTENDFDNSSQGMPKNPNLPAMSSNDMQDLSGNRDTSDLGSENANANANANVNVNANANDDAIGALNNLLEICRDGEYGFTECAEHAKTAELKSVFTQRAGDCRTAAAQLQQHIVQMGGTADSGGTMSGAVHRGWVSVGGTLAGFSDVSMLEECERSEDVALAQYRKALKENLPINVHALVERQAQGTQKNHDQIRNMRDAYKNASANS